MEIHNLLSYTLYFRLSKIPTQSKKSIPEPKRPKVEPWKLQRAQAKAVKEQRRPLRGCWGGSGRGFLIAGWLSWPWPRLSGGRVGAQSGLGQGETFQPSRRPSSWKIWSTCVTPKSQSRAFQRGPSGTKKQPTRLPGVGSNVSRNVSVHTTVRGFFGAPTYQGQSTPVGTRKIEFLHSQIEVLHLFHWVFAFFPLSFKDFL